MSRLSPWLLACLPHHAISRLTFWLTRRRLPLTDTLVRWFIRHYGVAMAEAAEPDPRAYPNFNAFFTRALRPGARPLAGDDATLAAPVDGRISQLGSIDAGTLVQAKGVDYSAAALLGSAAAASAFHNGAFATLYLAPGDYHRIHMPLAGELVHMTYIPGRLYSVAPATVAHLPGLFTRNERVCAHFETAHGRLAMVLVGAINVAAIETVWAGLVTPPRHRGVAETPYSGASAIHVPRGAEMGRFNMGSTVILLLDRSVAWAPDRQPGTRVRVGEALAHLD